jgi:hypothetical protein
MLIEWPRVTSPPERFVQEAAPLAVTAMTRVVSVGRREAARHVVDQRTSHLSRPSASRAPDRRAFQPKLRVGRDQTPACMGLVSHLPVHY